MKTTGGGREELRFIGGDVPRCMRNREETQTSEQRVKEKGSSSTARKEGSSKEEEMTGAAKRRLECKDTSGSSIMKKRHCAEAKTEARSHSL